MSGVSLARAARAAVAALALAACADGPRYAGRVTVDLNRTTGAVAMVSSVVSDSSVSFSLRPDEKGVYTFVTDTLPDDIYVMSLDSAHVLPLVLTGGAGQKVCGTISEWGSLSVSDSQTRAAVAAEGLRRRLAVATDSALTAGRLSSADGRREVADSLAKVRAAFRAESDALLKEIPDTSLASLPLVGMPGLYDDVADNSMLLRRATALADRWPRLTRLAERRDHLKKVSRLADLREAYAAGKPIQDFLFISEAGDSLYADRVTGRRVAFAVLPDSASTPQSVLSRLGLVALDGTMVLVQSDDRRVDVAGRSVLRGRFARLGRSADVSLFKPVVVVVGKDGRVERLSIGK